MTVPVASARTASRGPLRTGRAIARRSSRHRRGGFVSARLDGAARRRLGPRARSPAARSLNGRAEHRRRRARDPASAAGQRVVAAGLPALRRGSTRLDARPLGQGGPEGPRPATTSSRIVRVPLQAPAEQARLAALGPRHDRPSGAHLPGRAPALRRRRAQAARRRASRSRSASRTCSAGTGPTASTSAAPATARRARDQARVGDPERPDDLPHAARDRAGAEGARRGQPRARAHRSRCRAGRSRGRAIMGVEIAENVGAPPDGRPEYIRSARTTPASGPPTRRRWSGRSSSSTATRAATRSCARSCKGARTYIDPRAQRRRLQRDDRVRGPQPGRLVRGPGRLGRDRRAARAPRPAPTSARPARTGGNKANERDRRASRAPTTPPRRPGSSTAASTRTATTASSGAAPAPRATSTDQTYHGPAPWSEPETDGVPALAARPPAGGPDHEPHVHRPAPAPAGHGRPGAGARRGPAARARRRDGERDGLHVAVLLPALRHERARPTTTSTARSAASATRPRSARSSSTRLHDRLHPRVRRPARDDRFGNPTGQKLGGLRAAYTLAGLARARRRRTSQHADGHARPRAGRCGSPERPPTRPARSRTTTATSSRSRRSPSRATRRSSVGAGRHVRLDRQPVEPAQRRRDAVDADVRGRGRQRARDAAGLRRAQPGREPGVDVRRGLGPERPGAAARGLRPAERVRLGGRGRRSQGRLRISFSRTTGAGTATVEILQTAKGRRIVKQKRVARFTGRTGTFTWNGKRAGDKVANGVYVVRVSRQGRGRPHGRAARRRAAQAGQLREDAASSTSRTPACRHDVRPRRPGLPSKVGSPTVHFHGNPGRRRPQARLRRLPAALHLHGGARPPARVDPRLRDQGARAARRGVGGDDVPGLRLPPHGRAGAARALLPRGVRRAGRRLLLQPRAGRGDDPLRLRRPRHGRRGAHGHGHAAGPPVRHRGAEAALPRPRDRRREDLLPRDHRARRRLGRRGHPHARRARRRRVGDRRREDLHHQRPPRGLHRARGEDRPGRRARRHQPVPRRHGPARRRARAAAAEARHALLRHRAARLPGRARARRTRCSARRARASTTSCGSSRASA